MKSHEQISIEKENILSLSMLQHIAGDKQFRLDVLQPAGNAFAKVLKPFLEKIEKAKTFAELDPISSLLIQYLASEQTKEGSQLGGILKQYSIDDVVKANNNKRMKELLQTIIHTLETVGEADTLDKIAAVLKSMFDVSTVHVEMQRQVGKQEFKEMDSLLCQSPEELAARCLFAELGAGLKKSTTFGIGRSEGELIDAKEDAEFKHFRSGKSFFSGVSIKMRFELLAKKCREHYLAVQAAQKTLATLTDSEAITVAQIVLKNAEVEYQKLLAKIAADFGNSLSQRFQQAEDKALPIDDLAQRYQLSFIKLADRTEMPLVAQVSGSAARLLMAVDMLGAFVKDGYYDFDRIQKFGNAIMGMCGHAGHHSYVEVAESYNRYLDFIFLRHSEKLAEKDAKVSQPKLPFGLFHKMELLKKSVQMTKLKLKDASFEQTTGLYFEYGDYPSFLHRDYREKMMSQLPSHAVVPLRLTMR